VDLTTVKINNSVLALQDLAITKCHKTIFLCYFQFQWLSVIGKPAKYFLLFKFVHLIIFIWYQ